MAPAGLSASQRPIKASSVDLNRFWSNVEKTPTCWRWTGHKHGDGYGLFSLRGRTIRAHRLCWQMIRGHLPTYDPSTGHGSLLHSCNTRDCVNPDHLYLGSQLENMRDRARGPWHNRGENNGSAKLTAQQVRTIREKWASKQYQTLKELANFYNVSSHQIGWIVNHKSWRSVS